MAVHPLTLAMDHINAHPEEWDQGVWVCGTTACIAGRIILQAGLTVLAAENAQERGTRVVRNGVMTSTYDAARDLAHLTDAEAQYLFEAFRTLTELRHDTARLAQDLAMETDAEDYTHTHHHVWTDSDGGVMITAHRRTMFEVTPTAFLSVDFPTREACYDFASDVATARGLIYTWNTNPPEVPA